MLRCTGNNSSREYSGWFQFLVMDEWFLFDIVLIFLGTFSFSLVSATSSYADDVAHT
jgi:hypothetical protein